MTDAKYAEYFALAAYSGVTLVVFLGAILWSKYRRWIKRRLDIQGYQNDPPAGNDHHAPPAHSAS
jgi:hypothetical protein